jgi:hypothetical protein
LCPSLYLVEFHRLFGCRQPNLRIRPNNCRLGQGLLQPIVLHFGGKGTKKCFWPAGSETVALCQSQRPTIAVLRTRCAAATAAQEIERHAHFEKGIVRGIDAVDARNWIENDLPHFGI